jgi:hypothetical protein
MDGKPITRRRLLASAAALGAGLPVAEVLWAGAADEAVLQSAAETRKRDTMIRRGAV